MDAQPKLKISIVIKALNEAARIKDAIESALRALEGIGGEVVLADSGSTDGTVEIASAYPVAIVQLEDWSEKRCGIGPQLGYQFCRGEFIYILDGDMLLDAAFLPAALNHLPQTRNWQAWRASSTNTVKAVCSFGAASHATSRARQVRPNGSIWAGCTGALQSTRSGIFPTATSSRVKNRSWGCALAPPDGSSNGCL